MGTDASYRPPATVVAAAEAAEERAGDAALLALHDDVLAFGAAGDLAEHADAGLAGAKDGRASTAA